MESMVSKQAETQQQQKPLSQSLQEIVGIFLLLYKYLWMCSRQSVPLIVKRSLRLTDRLEMIF